MVGMEEIRTDVVVIGSGAAGLRAAIAARREGCTTLVVSKGTPALGSATILSDGFFGSSGPGMDKAEHMRLTLETGYHLNTPELVKILVEETPGQLKELAARGLAFAEGPGGMRAPRVRLGNIVIPHVLLRWATEAGVTLTGWTTVTDLLTYEGRVVGCSAISEGRPLSILAKATILCTGGAAALYLSHDNPTTNLGDGYAIAARAGATLKDMEFVQFYPLVTSEPGKPRVLIGPPLADVGRIVNDRGEDLVEKYDLSSLKPLGVRARDRLSRALFQEHLGGSQVFLDLRSMTEMDWQHPGAGKGVREFYETRYRCRTAPVPVMPAAHFTMGGIAIDEHGRTTVGGLFAAGEAAWGLHGANRMGGNALSETLVFGARAGIAAAAWARSVSRRDNPAPGGHPGRESSHGRTPLTVLKGLREIMWRYCGPVRTTQGIAQGVELVRRLEEEDLVCRSTAQAAMAISVRNGLSVARRILEAAQSRKESLGAHYREG
jgi:fumarate reductase (CoM/CoB) subunit A